MTLLGLLVMNFIPKNSVNNYNAETILHRIESSLQERRLDITGIRFWGISDCFIMYGEHSGHRRQSFTELNLPYRKGD